MGISSRKAEPSGAFHGKTASQTDEAVFQHTPSALSQQNLEEFRPPFARSGPTALRAALWAHRLRSHGYAPSSSNHLGRSSTRPSFFKFLLTQDTSALSQQNLEEFRPPFARSGPTALRAALWAHRLRSHGYAPSSSNHLGRSSTRPSFFKFLLTQDTRGVLKNGFTRLAGGLSVERSGRLRLSSVADAQSAPSSPKRSTKSLPTQTNKSVLQHPPRGGRRRAGAEVADGFGAAGGAPSPGAVSPSSRLAHPASGSESGAILRGCSGPRIGSGRRSCPSRWNWRSLMKTTMTRMAATRIGTGSRGLGFWRRCSMWMRSGARTAAVDFARSAR